MLRTFCLPSAIVAIISCLLLLVESYATESLDSVQEARCLTCIRNISSTLGIDTTKRCEGYFCGPYQLSYTYWAEAGKPGTSQGARDYEKCARDKSCAEQTVRAYFKKFKRDCNNDGTIDCRDMAALHKGGPTSCTSDWFYKSRYWLAFNKTSCMTNQDDSSDASKSNINEQPIRSMKNQSLTSECLDCICDAVSGCNTSVNNCGSGTVCGPFAISQAYWKDGRRPGASWTACTRTKECSSVAIKNYMEKYKRDCNGDGFITCEDYAAIHRRGPRACSNKDLSKDHYWNKFLACRANQTPVKDVNMVKVNEGIDDLVNSHNPTLVTVTSDTQPTAKQSTTSAPVPSHVLSIKSDDSSQIRHNIATSSSSAQTVTPVASGSSGRYDMSQTPTYELTSVVLDVKDENSSKTTPDKLPPLNAFGHHPVLTSQNGYHDSNKHNHDSKSTRRPEYSSEYRPSVSADQNYEPSSQRKSPNYVEPATSNAAKATSVPSWSTEGSATTISPSQTHTLSTTTHFLLPTTLPAQSPINKHQASAASATVVSKNQDDASKQSGPNPNAIEHPAQAVPNFSLMDQPMHQPAPNEEVNDYSIPDYPFSAQGSEIDRATSFDKVVIGIVGSADFSKSYPPIPDIMMQGKQSNDSPQINDLHPQPTIRSQQRVNTNHSKASVANSNNNNNSSINKSSDTSISSSQELAQSSVTDKTPTTFSSTGSTTQDQQRQLDKSGDAFLAQQPNLSSMLGSENLNVSSLFEKGLNESSRIASECLECICDASSNCDTTVQCISKQREKNRCGLYMISWNQYQESDISLTSLIPMPVGVSEELADERMYYECTTDRLCAEKLIHLYIEKHQKDCNNDGKIDCYDIAAIHRVGPNSCNSGKFLSSQYWKDFNICYTTDRLTTTTMQTQPAILRFLH